MSALSRFLDIQTTYTADSRGNQNIWQTIERVINKNKGKTGKKQSLDERMSLGVQLQRYYSPPKEPFSDLQTSELARRLSI